MPSISTIIPVYNTERYLRRCLDSIARQTYADWEALCVDDGSTDGSLAILREYASRDSRFRIISKPNGGLSDARNAGLAAATGEYINFVDSDDLIHPQTFEIALALAKRDGSDIVTWYKDPLFRPSTRLRRRLGVDVDSAIPWNIDRRFALERVTSTVTRNVFAHAVALGAPSVPPPIKRFYAWRHLIRRSFHEGILFVKGILYEDFPWWSEVMLRNPQVTITQLPLYYYFPNPASIDMGSTEIRKIHNWLLGLKYAWQLCEAHASAEQRALWSQQCKWSVINHGIARKVERVSDRAARQALRAEMAAQWELGVFSDPPNAKMKRVQQRVSHFINQPN